MLLPLAPTLLLLLIPFATLRLLLILQRNRFTGKKQHSRPVGTPTHLLVVLGSGGHTAEMLSLIRNIDTSKFTHRTYVISSGDAFSADLAASFEEKLRDRTAAQPDLCGTFTIATVPRARKIHQSILRTPISSLHCLLHCLKVLLLGAFGSRPPSTTESSATSPDQLQPPMSHYTAPDLIMTNGPATGVIVVLASLILRFLGLPFALSLLAPRYNPTQKLSQPPRAEMRTIYVESWARVRTLSLSGKILLRVVDRFIVQWPRLVTETHGRGEYLGMLVE